MNKLNKLYETLTNDERIKLLLQAFARNDEQEIDSLEGSCPRKSYRMADYKYTTKKVDALVMTAYQMLDSYHCLTVAMSSVIGMLAYENSEDEKKQESYDVAENAFNTSISLFKAKEEAWKQFCDEAGLDDRLTREAFKIVIPWGENGVCYYLESIAHDIQPNLKAIENSKAQLHSIWER